MVRRLAAQAHGDRSTWWFFQPIWILAVTAAVLGCRSTGPAPVDVQSRLQQGTQLIDQVRGEIEAASTSGLYRVSLEQRGGELVLSGEVDSAAARSATLKKLQSAGFKVRDAVEVLAEPGPGERAWGICVVSTGNAREQVSHKAELGTQLLMGDVVRIWKETNDTFLEWCLVQGEDGYTAYQPAGNLAGLTRPEVDEWLKRPLLVVTTFNADVLREPKPGSEAVFNVVLLNRLEKVGELPEWYKVRLPDGREGYLLKGAAEDYQAWKQGRVATAENIERSARRFLGRPYLWGGNSPAGVDCSGFTKLVYTQNGIDLKRNASQQARQGREISLGNDFADLKKGDLLFFWTQSSRWEARTCHPRRNLSRGQKIHPLCRHGEGQQPGPEFSRWGRGCAARQPPAARAPGSS